MVILHFRRKLAPLGDWWWLDKFENENIVVFENDQSDGTKMLDDVVFTKLIWTS